MADLYNAPELRNHYCKNCCPLGGDVPQIDMESLDRIALKALQSMKTVSASRGRLLEIVSDGIISEEEKPRLEEIMRSLSELEQISHNLRTWVKKNL